MSDEVEQLSLFGEEQEANFDDFDENGVEAKVQLGDLWQLGNHRLLCADSTIKENIERLRGGNSIDMIFTDPPYGMNLDTDYSCMKNKLEFANDKHFIGGKKYDQGIVDEFNPKMIETIMSLNVKEIFLWGANYFAELLPNRNNGSWVVWDKRSNGKIKDIKADESSDKMYGSCFELCWSKNKHKQDIARVKWAGVFGTEKEFDHRRYHPTQKPILLCEWFITRYSKSKQNIMDLFGGSGSTLIACERQSRNCYIMELDPHYCDVIIHRWEKLTGKQAVLLERNK